VGNVTLLAKSQTIKIGKEPLVLVPLSLWRKVEDVLEDQEALASKRYLRRIRQARKDIAAGKAVYPFR
jgi:PHD/YefM family antitoxin component YafN of YafNO toxin-antitoxin module